MTFKATQDSQKIAAKVLEEQVDKVHKRFSFVKLHVFGASSFTLQLYNNPDMGHILCGDDGYFAYWPKLVAGYWSEGMLETIAKVLSILNEPWDKQVREYHFDEFHRKLKDGTESST